MSLKTYDFRCPAGHEFEDLSSYSDERGGVVPVPCPECGRASTNYWKLGTRMAVRDATLSSEERLQAIAQYGKFDKDGNLLTKVETRSDLSRLMDENGDDLVLTAKQFNRRLLEYQHATPDEGPKTIDEYHKAFPREEIDRRRAETIPLMRQVNAMHAAGTLPVTRELPADAPDEVKKAVTSGL